MLDRAAGGVVGGTPVAEAPRVGQVARGGLVVARPGAAERHRASGARAGRGRRRLGIRSRVGPGDRHLHRVGVGEALRVGDRQLGGVGPGLAVGVLRLRRGGVLAAVAVEVPRVVQVGRVLGVGRPGAVELHLLARRRRRRRRGSVRGRSGVARLGRQVAVAVVERPATGTHVEGDVAGQVAVGRGRPDTCARHRGDVEGEAAELEPPRVGDGRVAAVDLAVGRVGVVVGVALAGVGEGRVPGRGGPRRVVEVRSRLARLRLAVQRRLGRRVVGADVAVAVALVGVGDVEAGLEGQRRTVVLVLAVRVEAGAVAHLEVVGVVGRRLRGGVDEAPALGALRGHGGVALAAAVEDAEVVRTALALEVGVEQHPRAVVGQRRGHLEVVDEPARTREPGVGAVAQPQRALLRAHQVAHVEGVREELRRRRRRGQPVDLQLGRRLPVRRAVAGDAVAVLGLAGVLVGVGRRRCRRRVARSRGGVRGVVLATVGRGHHEAVVVVPLDVEA